MSCINEVEEAVVIVDVACSDKSELNRLQHKDVVCETEKLYCGVKVQWMLRFVQSALC